MVRLHYFKLVKEEGIARIVIDRAAQRNAFNAAMWVQLAEIIDKLAADTDTKAIIITGAGSSFASGADITQLKELTDHARRLDYIGRVEKAIESINGCPQPVIAMINGWAMGAGCELAIACDMRICAAEARLGIPAAKLGISLHRALIRRLVNLVGEAAAKELLLVGEPVSAARAYAAGLVNRVVPAPELEAAALELARKICGNAPLAVKGMKKTISECSACNEYDGHAGVDLAEKDSFESEDFIEGVNAFIEKRMPVWKGK